MEPPPESAVLRSLGLAAWQRCEDGTFQAIGELPPWWTELGWPASPSLLDADFLANFLIDAGRLWDSKRLEKIDSGIWEHDNPRGGYLLLQLHATRTPEGQFLIFQDLDATDSVWRDLLQSGRQRQLDLLRDISQRKQLELELRRAKATAEQLEKAKMEFFAKTNHEIRTPLTSILAMTEMIGETPLDNTQSDYVRHARQAAETLLRIMNDVLDFSKMEQGALSLELAPVELTPLLEELCTDFAAAAEERGVRWSVKWVGEPPQLITDAVRLRQVLNNLVHNALRFTDQGEVRVEAEFEAPEDRVAFRVVDTGCGIPVEQQQRIFDSFVAGPPAAPARGHGIGSFNRQPARRIAGGPVARDQQARRRLSILLLCSLPPGPHRTRTVTDGTATDETATDRIAAHPHRGCSARGRGHSGRTEDRGG